MATLVADLDDPLGPRTDAGTPVRASLNFLRAMQAAGISDEGSWAETGA